jgi:hypothetical protein
MKIVLDNIEFVNQKGDACSYQIIKFPLGAGTIGIPPLCPYKKGQEMEVDVWMHMALDVPPGFANTTFTVNSGALNILCLNIQFTI